ncbi:MAG TPA: hypothetical protein VH394_19945 [Thermoanaerobaculia bacterium]|jgi:hypothetical protein|nr:hypothetical protein [Thermoanaerobaculia bacterium]
MVRQAKTILCISALAWLVASGDAAACDGVTISTGLCAQGPSNDVQPVEIYIAGKRAHTFPASRCYNSIETHKWCVEPAVPDVDLRLVRLAVTQWNYDPNLPPGKDGFRGVGINGIAKDRGAEPRWIPIDGLAATATTPAYPVYKLNAGKGGSTPTAQCFSGSSIPPKNQGYGALTRMLCLSDWRCYNPYNKVCGEQAFADFGNDSAEYAPTP